MKSLTAGVLEIAYHETGPVDGHPVVLLHDFPYDARAYDITSAQLAAQGFRCLVPYLRGFGPTRFLSSDTPCAPGNKRRSAQTCWPSWMP